MPTRSRWASPRSTRSSQLKGIPGYVEAFKTAFPGEADPITYDNIEAAIALFEATLITPDARSTAGWEATTRRWTPTQKQGLAIFIEKGCATCHNGINIGGGMYAPFGVVEKPGWEIPAAGRQRPLRGDQDRRGRLRLQGAELAEHRADAPYFHTGNAWDLRQAVAVMGQSQLGEVLTEPEIDQVTAFLRALTGEQPRVEFPLLPPSVATTPRPEP